MERWLPQRRCSPQVGAMRASGRAGTDRGAARRGDRKNVSRMPIGSCQKKGKAARGSLPFLVGLYGSVSGRSRRHRRRHRHRHIRRGHRHRYAARGVWLR